MKLTKFRANSNDFLKISTATGLEVTLCNLGASIFSIVYKGKRMTLTPTYECFAQKTCYHGKTIGRYANRIVGNKLAFDGMEYTLENNDGENTLHGGTNGISTKRFRENIRLKDNFYEISYVCYSKDLEGGFPGNLTLTVIYRIYNKKPQIDVNYYASTDKPTVCSLANHAYFNLGDNDISKLLLKVKGNTYIRTDSETRLPIEVAYVSEALDFTQGKSVMKDIEAEELQSSRGNGYDHCFFFNEQNATIPQVQLENDEFKMAVYTDFAAVQIYTDNKEGNRKYLDNNATIHRAVAIEPQDGFDQIFLLEPKKMYTRKIKYVFRKK